MPEVIVVTATPTETPQPGGGCGTMSVGFSLFGAYASGLRIVMGTDILNGPGQISFIVNTCNAVGGYWLDLEDLYGNPPGVYAMCRLEQHKGSCSFNTSAGGCFPNIQIAPGQKVPVFIPNGDGGSYSCDANNIPNLGTGFPYLYPYPYPYPGYPGYPYPPIPPYPYPQVPYPPQPSSVGPGQFYPQTGFWVRDGVQIYGITANFFSEYQRFGGPVIIGYPVSRPFWKDNYLYQGFQRGILQWRPELNQAVIANTMDWFYQLGLDGFLASRGIPSQVVAYDGCLIGDIGCSMRVRFGWMTDQSIRDAYFANPGVAVWDPVSFYGLPTSYPQRFGSFTAQRFQKYVFQKWEMYQPGMPAPGTVSGVLIGDLAKEAGIIPAYAVAPEAP
ncbi:MAG: hypothetical protein M1370_02165 [Bacteroidetes bacterium]|nr:hypothetical protein [Bacteroidota bacterium]MCL5026133.1 hypothetical protein [Chloroflexota bacterium]